MRRCRVRVVGSYRYKLKSWYYLMYGNIRIIPNFCNFSDYIEDAISFKMFYFVYKILNLEI